MSADLRSCSCGLVLVLVTLKTARQGYWATGLLGYWATGLLGYWATGLLGYWATGLLGYWATGLLGCWAAGLLGYWAAGLLGCWAAGLLGCWAAGCRLLGCRVIVQSLIDLAQIFFSQHANRRLQTQLADQIVVFRLIQIAPGGIGLLLRVEHIQIGTHADLIPKLAGLQQAFAGLQRLLQ